MEKQRLHALSILIAGQSGSASKYIAQEVEKAFDIPTIEVLIAGDGHDGHLIRDRLQSLVECGGLRMEHLSPRIENLIALTASGLKKVWVHVRDPRQSVLSMLVHWNRRYSVCKQADNQDSWYEKTLTESFFSKGFFEADLSTQIDEAISAYLPVVIGFINGWLRAADDPRWGLDILFTNFETLKTSRHAFFEPILDFYGVPKAPWPFPEQEDRASAPYFRKGAIEEFRCVYSPNQLAEANRLMPVALLEKFKWMP